jgi:hypothetical protein
MTKHNSPPRINPTTPLVALDMVVLDTETT